MSVSETAPALAAASTSRVRRLWLPVLSLLVVAIVVGIGWLQHTQWHRFEATVSESRAGVEWDLFQLQAERYKMLAKLNEALLTRGDPAVMDSVVLRHEVLISRLEIMRSGSGPRASFRFPENRPFFDLMEAYAHAGDAYFGLNGDTPAFDEGRVRGLRDALEAMSGPVQDVILNINTIHNDQARMRGEQLRRQAVVSGLTSMALAVLVGAMGLIALRQLTRVRENNVELIQVQDQLKEALVRAEIGNEALSASERRLKGLIDTAKDAIVSIDQSQRVIVFNSAAEHMFGRSAVDMIGRPLDMLLPESTRGRHHGFVARFGQNGSTPRAMSSMGGLTAVRASGEVFPIEASISASDASGQLTYLVIIRDVTERERAFRALQESENSLREAQGRVRQLAYFDSLTKIPNRACFVEEVAGLLREAIERSSLGAALLIDLDNFKAINDNWGHRSGDKLLVEMARRIVSTVPVDAFVARLGGDEFIVVLTGLGPDAQAATARVREICRALLPSLSAPCVLDEREHVCSASIGVALFGDAPLLADELLSRADSAMYQAKADGRNDFRFFDQRLQARLAGLSEMEADLRLAIGRGELQLHYQPQVDGDGAVIGVEALVRWFHPVRGAVSPGEFIPIAESSGHILQLGPWVMQTACETLAAWAHDEVTAALSMAVNVSARQFHHPEFVNQVIAALRLSGANPMRLKLELTESVLAQDLGVIAQKMSALKALGVTFSLDDFGTGYSSLAYLKRLPLDQIKIDRGFVRGLPGNANDAAIVRTVIALGQQLGFEIIAEGVETDEQLDFLCRHGCQLYQGYLFGRPVPLHALLPVHDETPVPANG
ncbi:putative bifunctional diguanylate cyclase/phosphodiesterase [Leptothrix discophora]|uniref:EAL domain-containing protein n=1 Tax=Leptothrix discophora TaxID=89 RepID=A0ABT9FZP9_LEPDI|nr:GGDEF domain-containing phosphodiesterase [Leptothrix discophora]MDP4299693.1 EAL domain-containing protein [Leptothrix discophora]